MDSLINASIISAGIAISSAILVARSHKKKANNTLTDEQELDSNNGKPIPHPSFFKKKSRKRTCKIKRKRGYLQRTKVLIPDTLDNLVLTLNECSKKPYNRPSSISSDNKYILSYYPKDFEGEKLHKAYQCAANSIHLSIDLIPLFPTLFPSYYVDSDCESGATDCWEIWGNITKNPNLKLEWVLKYPKKPWCWGTLSCKFLTFDNAEKWLRELPNAPWRWDLVSRNKMTDKDKLIKLIKKYPNKPWDWKYISKHNLI